MKVHIMIASLLVTSATAWGAAPRAASTPTVNSGCHATFTLADARVLATATPNARAFVENYGATLDTAIHSQTGNSANIVVIASDAKHGTTDVGIYTVSLKTGKVTDDDMEPAEDDNTATVRNKLLSHHCTAK